jgi:uncharacterized coiled-coil protein SlyX
MEQPDRPRLGEVLRKQGLINDDELAEALAVQEQTGKPLGEVLTDELNRISIATLRDALAVQQRWRPLGQLLVERKLLTEEQLVEALEEQERTGAQLGDVLRSRFYLASATLDELLREQHELELELDRGYASGLRAALQRRTQPRAVHDEQQALASMNSSLGSRLSTPVSEAHLHVALKTVENGAKRIATLDGLIATQHDEIDHLRDVLVDRELTIAELNQRIADLEALLPGTDGAAPPPEAAPDV